MPSTPLGWDALIRAAALAAQGGPRVVDDHGSRVVRIPRTRTVSPLEALMSARTPKTPPPAAQASLGAAGVRATPDALPRAGRTLPHPAVDLVVMAAVSLALGGAFVGSLLWFIRTSNEAAVAAVGALFVGVVAWALSERQARRDAEREAAQALTRDEVLRLAESIARHPSTFNRRGGGL